MRTEYVYREYRVTGARTKAIQAFQDRISPLKFLAPACGSGDFPTEAYLSLRRMENEAIAHFHRYGEDIQLGMENVT